jgi:hypothetical protein
MLRIRHSLWRLYGFLAAFGGVRTTEAHIAADVARMSAMPNFAALSARMPSEAPVFRFHRVNDADERRANDDHSRPHLG